MSGEGEQMSELALETHPSIPVKQKIENFTAACVVSFGTLL